MSQEEVFEIDEDYCELGDESILSIKEHRRPSKSANNYYDGLFYSTDEDKNQQSTQFNS